jgi:hypothetical protein
VHVLDCLEHAEDREVIDRRRRAVPSFEPRIAVRVEEVATVGRESEILVGDTTMQGPGYSEEPVPGACTVLECLLSMDGRTLFELLDESANGITRVVAIVVAREEPALLCKQEKKHPHHDGDDSGVEIVVTHAREDRSARLAIEVIETIDEHLDGGSDLIAERDGDLFLCFSTVFEKGWKSLVDADAEESSSLKEGNEAGEALRLLAPQARIPHG